MKSNFLCFDPFLNTNYSHIILCLRGCAGLPPHNVFTFSPGEKRFLLEKQLFQVLSRRLHGLHRRLLLAPGPEGGRAEPEHPGADF